MLCLGRRGRFSAFRVLRRSLGKEQLQILSQPKVTKSKTPCLLVKIVRMQEIYSPEIIWIFPASSVKCCDMSSPKLSICIPTYNRSGRLDVLLRSVADQVSALGLEEKVEIVISDNASTDSTQKVGEKWTARYPFIRYFRNSSNFGGEPNFVLSIERATGEFAWVLGDDDRIREGALARILSYLQPGVSQLFLNFRCISPQGECLVPGRIDSAIPENIRTIDLIRRIGFVSAYALISSHVFDRGKLLAVKPALLLKTSPYYILNTALLTAFHDQVCQVVHEPLVDYTVDNERLPHESGLYVRVLGLLRTLQWLEAAGIIDTAFLYGCYETGNGAHFPSIFLREELYGSLIELQNYWALPGRADLRMIRDFIDRGPGFIGQRNQLKGFFSHDYEEYSKHPRPMMHHWHGKAWIPSFSILLASDALNECEAFDKWLLRWPAEFAHESILVSNLPEHDVPVSQVDVHMSPFREHREPCSALNSGLRKILAPYLLILNGVCSESVAGLINKVESWRIRGGGPSSVLIFASTKSRRTGLPDELLGLYVRCDDLVRRGGFENFFKNWSRQRLLADAGFRLDSPAWAVDGGDISRDALRAWFSSQLPLGIRMMRKIYPALLSEHGLNIARRHHLQAALDPS